MRSQVVALDVADDRGPRLFEVRVAGITGPQAEDVATEGLVGGVRADDAEDGGQYVELTHGVAAPFAGIAEDFGAVEQNRDVLVENAERREARRYAEAVVAGEDKEGVRKPRRVPGLLHEFADGPVGVVNAVEAIVLFASVFDGLEAVNFGEVEWGVVRQGKDQAEERFAGLREGVEFLARAVENVVV